MKRVDDWKQALGFGSVQVSGAGALAGAVAAGLMASGAVVPWLGLIPKWAIFAGGSLICTLTIIARLFRRLRPHERQRKNWEDYS